MIQLQHQPIENEIKAQLEFFADVEFGNPKTKDCRNFGICRIHALVKTKYNNKRSCKKCSTITKITVFNRHHVSMDFLRSNIQSCTYKKYFATNTFRIEEAYTYTSEKEEHNFKITKGSYPIIKGKQLLKVIFKSNTVTAHNVSDT